MSRGVASRRSLVYNRDFFVSSRSLGCLLQTPVVGRAWPAGRARRDGATTRRCRSASARTCTSSRCSGDASVGAPPTRRWSSTIAAAVAAAAPARRFARADDGGGLRRCASRASREGLSRGRLIATPEHDEFFCATDPFAFFNVLAHFFGSSHAFLAAALRSAPTSTLTRAAWVRHVLHARMGCMPACVSWCAPCDRVVCAVTMVLSRMSGVVRRRVSMLPCVCVPFHRTLPGWSAVSDPCEARPCQARVARTLSC